MGAGAVLVHVEPRREGRGLKAGGGGGRRPLPAARAWSGPGPRAGVGRACCEMDTPLPSGSDSDSEESLVTDREVSASRARVAGQVGRGTSSLPCTDADRALQLQDAFSRGLLKPGLNVVLEGPKKAVNNVVSRGYWDVR